MSLTRYMFTVATFYVLTMTITCSTLTEQLRDTIIVASADKE